VVSLQRGFDDAEPVRPEPLETVEERRSTRTRKLGSGTIACPVCDAPIAFAGASMKPRDPLSCPVCLHAGTVREFLSLAQPTRPTKVAIYVVAPSAA
jgi:hypothetical protein